MPSPTARLNNVLYSAVQNIANGNKTDMPTLLRNVRSRGQSGKHLLAASISPFDPKATLAGSSVDLC